MSARAIADDVEALAVAAALAEEPDRLSASGLLAVTVPAEHGGAGVRQETLAEACRLPASADAGLAQIPQNHVVYMNVLRRQGTPQQQTFLFGEVLAGRRFRNARSEAGARHVQDTRTRLAPGPDGRTSSPASSTAPPACSSPTGTARAGG